MVSQPMWIEELIAAGTEPTIFQLKRNGRTRHHHGHNNNGSRNKEVLGQNFVTLKNSKI